MLILILEKNTLTPENLAEIKKLGEVTKELKEIGKADVVVSPSTIVIGEDIINKAVNLKLIIAASAGYDFIDLNLAEKRGITVCNCPTYHIISVAEFTLGLIISLSRKIARASRNLSIGFWQPFNFQGTDLNGRTLGVVGYGKVGRKVANLARAFGMKVLSVTGKSPREKFINLLRNSDVITIHAR